MRVEARFSQATVVWGSIILVLLGVPVLWFAVSALLMSHCPDWQDWQRFKGAFISADGRVVDYDSPRQHTVSEAQAYAAFFALVANDRDSFDKLLAWTENNLAKGDLTAQLPAWHWGRKDDGSWGVLDENSASDADLWLVYVLGEAGRLWNEPRYQALSALLANRMLRSEVVDGGPIGPLLLPGAQGFQLTASAWRLNPSYLPLFILQRLAGDYPNSPWSAILHSSVRVIEASAPQGFAADWLIYSREAGFAADSEHPSVGSYDAIRVYLWAGMLDADDPLRSQLLLRLQGMAEYLAKQGMPPERVDTASGATQGVGSPGFSAALLPFLAARNQKKSLQEQLQRLQAKPIAAAPHAYYDHVLALFGLGWQQGRFAFAANGELITGWNRSCAVSR